MWSRLSAPLKYSLPLRFKARCPAVRNGEELFVEALFLPFFVLAKVHFEVL